MAPNVSSKSNKTNKIKKNQDKMFANYNKQMTKLKKKLKKTLLMLEKIPARENHYGEKDESLFTARQLKKRERISRRGHIIG